MPKMRPIRVYVAGPISKGNVYMNCIAGIQVAEELRLLGYVPFCPHLSYWWHEVVGHRVTHDEWLAYDLEWLALCDTVLRMPGESIGADMEVAHAKRLGIPVFNSIEELHNAIHQDGRKKKIRKGHTGHRANS